MTQTNAFPLIRNTEALRKRRFDLLVIGGGIFLAPYLHITRWAGAKQIAATASLFILVNSIAGLGGQLLKLGSSGALPDVGAA